MSKSPNELIVLLGGQIIGSVLHPPGGHREFRYVSDWGDVFTPLSISMPQRQVAYGHNQIDSYLWGLIPDNAETREQIGLRFDIPSRNPMAILSKIGLDCAGAVQFCTPDGVDNALKGKGKFIEISDEDISDKLKELNAGNISTIPSDHESWSLGGNQAKMAVRLEDGRWNIATGAEATSHIFKPGIQALDLQAVSEYITMNLAKKSGLQVPNVRYMEFNGEPAICIERYDRLRTDTGKLIRIHQEDMCQVFSIDSSNKYPSDGGPTADMILDKLSLIGQANLRTKNREDFAKALFFNYMVAAPDAHGKNYSVLLFGNSVRFAPLYDVASGLSYVKKNGELQFANGAMRIGGENKFGNLRRRHLIKFAERNNFAEEWIVDQFKHFADTIPGAAEELFDENKDIKAVSKLRRIMLNALNGYCKQVVVDLKL